MMTTTFIEAYQNLITVHFNFEKLAADPTITVMTCAKSLTDFLNYYVPRYAKNGVWDDRDISQVIRDKNSVLVKLQDVINSPEAWGLVPFDTVHEIKKRLWPIPLATDTETGRTLILDSNHTICTLLINKIKINVPCIELAGKNISSLAIDLR